MRSASGGSPRPSVRTLALLALLVVGLACSFAFHAVAASEMQVTYAATAVQPGDDPHRVADAASGVVDLDERLDDESAAVRRPVDRATRTGSFEGNVTPELHTILDGTEADYAVYGGSYYRWNLTVGDETTHVRIRTTPVDAATVLADVSEPYDTAPPEVRTAIDTGSVSGWNVVPGVYRRGDAYYAVAPENDAAVATKLLEAFAGYLLTPVGRGYVAVALGLLAYRYRDPHTDRPLTVRRAAAVAALAVPVSLLGTLLFESGSASRFLTGPASATVVAAGVVAGVFVHRRRWGALVGFTALVAGAALAASAAALGPVGAVFGGVSLVVGLVCGVVPLGFGVAFATEET